MTTANPTVKIGNVTFSNSVPLALIAGPCQMETREHAFDMAGRLVEITNKLGIGLVYKSSFDKANRTSLSAQRGIGLEKARKSLPISRKSLVFPCSPTFTMNISAQQWQKSLMSCRFLHSCAARLICLLLLQRQAV